MTSHNKLIFMNIPRLPQLLATMASLLVLLSPARASAQSVNGLRYFTAAPTAPVRRAGLGLLEYEAYSFREVFSNRTLSILADVGYSTGPFMEIQGMATIGGELYGIEKEQGSGTNYLTKADERALFARVATGTAISVPEVEALVWNGQKLIAAGRGPQPNTTTLVELSPTTGLTTALPIPSLDAQLVGMAYDPDAKIVYGVSKPDVRFGGSGILYRVNIDNGTLTVVGKLDRAFRSLTWVDPLGLVGGAERIFMIRTTDATLTPLVSAPEFSFGPDLGITALAMKGSYVLVHAPDSNLVEANKRVNRRTHTVLPSLTVNEGVVGLDWNSRFSGSGFYLEYSPDMRFWNWEQLSDFPNNLESQAAGTHMNYEHHPGAYLNKGFYQLYETEPTASSDPIRMLAVLGLLALASVGSITFRKRA